VELASKSQLSQPLRPVDQRVYQDLTPSWLQTPIMASSAVLRNLQ